MLCITFNRINVQYRRFSCRIWLAWTAPVIGSGIIIWISPVSSSTYYIRSRLLWEWSARRPRCPSGVAVRKVVVFEKMKPSPRMLIYVMFANILTSFPNVKLTGWPSVKFYNGIIVYSLYIVRGRMDCSPLQC